MWKLCIIFIAFRIFLCPEKSGKIRKTLMPECCVHGIPVSPYLSTTLGSDGGLVSSMLQSSVGAAESCLHWFPHSAPLQAADGPTLGAEGGQTVLLLHSAAIGPATTRQNDHFLTWECPFPFTIYSYFLCLWFKFNNSNELLHLWFIH